MGTKGADTQLALGDRPEGEADMDNLTFLVLQVKDLVEKKQ